MDRDRHFPLRRAARPQLHLSIFVVAFLLLGGCGADEPPEAPLRPVRTLRVVSTGGSRVRTFSGATQAGMESRLSFRVGGQIRRLPIKVGDHTAAGQLLAELDSADYVLHVEQMEASLAQTGAAERKARADYDRVRQLYENENASRNDLDGARAAFESAEAQARSVDRQLELARRQLRYTELRAPMECDVASILVEENENVTPGQDVVLLTAGSTPEVQVAMPEILIAHVIEGSQVEVTFDAIPGETYIAIVTEVGVQPEETATTFPVTVRLERAGAGIRPGMAAEVAFRFAATEAGEHVFVPPVAVGEDRQGRFVFVIEPGDGEVATVHRRPVEVGSLSADGLEILAGLEEGEIVVVAGVSKIQDGQQVKWTAQSGTRS